MKTAPQVGRIMGSDSDEETMQYAVTSRTESGLPHEARGISARGHRFALADSPS